MTTLQIQVKDTLTPMTAALQRRSRNPLPGLSIAGRALSNLLKAHYRSEAQIPNRMGAPRSYFWLAVAQGVNAPEPSGPASVRVSIVHPAINQKIFGGVITAKRAGALTIPLVPAAYNRSASVLERFLGIKLFRVKNVLAAWDKNAKKLTAYYALVKSVRQAPDPNALPPQADMERTVTEAWEKWFFGNPGTQVNS